MSATQKDLDRFAVRIDELPNRGRVLIAQRDLQPGHLVISNRPYARTLRPSLWSDRCFQCMATLPEQGIKSSCIWYCSQRCQQVDYLLHHQVEGPLLDSLRATIKSDDILSDMILVARTLRRTHSQGQQDILYASLQGQHTTSSSSGSSINSEPAPIVSTGTDVRKLVYHEPEDLTSVTSVAQSVLDAGLLGPNLQDKVSVDEIVKTLLCFGCNNFAVTSNLLVTVGAACTPAGAILNHACSPNTAVTWNSKTGAQEIRCCCVVKEGEELTHSYTDAAMPTDERRQKLRGEYGFVCGCDRCATPMETQLAPCFRMELKMAARALTSFDDVSVTEMAAQVNVLSDAIDHEWNIDSCMRGDLLGQTILLSEHQEGGATSAVEMARNQDVAKARAVLEQSINVTSDKEQMVLLQEASALYAKWLHPLHLDRLKLTNEMLSVALALGDYKAAVRHVRRAVVVYDHVYGTSYFHPMVGLQTYTLGNLYFEIQKYKEATASLGRSVETLRATHGEMSDLVLQLTQLWNQSATVTRAMRKGGVSAEKGRGPTKKNKKKKKGKKGKKQ
jgi:hypothetical protein